jgi:hypothetical protein
MKARKNITLVWKDLETVPGHTPSEIGYAGANKVAQIIYENPIRIILLRRRGRNQISITCDLVNLAKTIAQAAYNELK